MRNFRMRTALPRVGRVAALCLCAALLGSVAEAEEEYLQLRGAMHVRSAFSSGEESIEQIARRAVARKIDVLVMGDAGLLRIDYGIPFLRRLVRFGCEQNSLVAGNALGAYLDEIERVDALFPDLIVIDGVESAPFYYWEVKPGQRRWILRDWNKRLLAVGLKSEEAYARLPVSGSEHLRIWHWSSLLLAWPLLGLLYGWVARARHPAGLRYAVVALSGICLINNFPFKVALWDAYSGSLGAAPYQYYIDYVLDRGGLVFWTAPASEAGIAPVEGDVVIVSHASRNPAEWERTRGFTGFTGIHAEQSLAAEPGRWWDQILQRHMVGKWEEPVWGASGPDTGLDAAARPDRTDGSLTVFLARERSREGVLAAMREGRMYAVQGGDEMLVLERFQVETRRGRAVAGGSVQSLGSARVHVRIAEASGAEERVEVRLIRGGQVVAQARGTTPLEFGHIDAGIDVGERTYYRLLANTRAARLATNPIFVSGAAP